MILDASCKAIKQYCKKKVIETFNMAVVIAIMAQKGGTEENLRNKRDKFEKQKKAEHKKQWAGLNRNNIVGETKRI